MKINDVGMPFTSEAGDRAYSSADWREYFDKLLDGGIVGDIGNELSVEPQAVPNKSVYVDTGAIFIKGAMRVVETTTTLTLSDNTSGNARIDRIVARLNHTDRKIEFDVLEGTPAASPSAPSLTRNTIKWELSLAQIAVANGYSTITASEITDERNDETLCGYFRYRAKPAWYPGDDVPQDAYMYLLFKDQLTAGEIADIEANSTLMAIINAANVLAKNNTTAFTPTADYHPAPKKYVDDQIAATHLFAFGSYIGDGTSDRTVALAFTPVFVVISGRATYDLIGMGGKNFGYAGMFGGSDKALVDDGNTAGPGMTTNGFKITSTLGVLDVNQDTKTYNYIAFG